MADETDLALRRYGSALHRWWYIVVVPAVAFAILLGATGAGQGVASSRVVEVRFSVADTQALFGEVVLTPPQPGLSFRGFADLLASPVTEATIEQETGQTVEVTVRGLEEARTMVVTIRGRSRPAVDAVADAYVVYAEDQRRQDLLGVIVEARGILDAQRAVADERIAVVDTALEQIPVADARSPVAEALQGERETLVGERTKLDFSGRLLDAIDDGNVPLVKEVERRPRENPPVGTTLYRAVFGGIAGAVLGVIAVFVVVGLSRRLRTTADVERVAGDGSVLGRADRDGIVPPLVALALARRAQVGTLYVLGLDGATTAAVRDSVARSTGADDPTVSVVDGGDVTGSNVSARVLASDSEAAGAVLVVREGVTRPSDLDDAVRAVRAAEIRLIGVVVQRRT